MKKFSTDRDKLEQISNFFRLSAVNFAAKIDVSKDKIYNIRRGVVVNFPPDVLRNIAKCCPEISPYWLITGEGSMLSGSIEHHNAVANDHSKAIVNHNTSAKAMYYAGQQTATENQSVAVFLLANPLAKHCYLGILTALSAVVVRILRRRTS